MPSSERIKVMHCITSMHPDGAQNMLLKLCRTYDRTRFDFSVVSLVSKGALEQAFLDAGVTLHSLDMKPARPNFRALFKLRELISETKPDILQGWMYHSHLFALAAQKIYSSKLPLLWNVRRAVHDLQEDPLLKRIVTKLNALCSSIPEKIIYCGSVIAEQHEQIGFDPSKRIVITNGFDLTQFSPSPLSRASLRSELGIAPESLIVGMAGRFHFQKDHQNFILMAKETLLKLPETHFVLVGRDCDWKNETLCSWISSAGLPRQQIHLLGEKSNVQNYVRGFDVFCLSSLIEGFPNVVGEAMACGVPCAVTNAGAAAEVVGDTGLVVPRKDPEKLSKAVVALLSLSPDERRLLGERARTRVEELFSITNIVRSYQELYEQILSTKPEGIFHSAQL